MESGDLIGEGPLKTTFAVALRKAAHRKLERKCP
jgi:hypothetical protein